MNGSHPSPMSDSEAPPTNAAPDRRRQPRDFSQPPPALVGPPATISQKMAQPPHNLYPPVEYGMPKATTYSVLSLSWSPQWVRAASSLRLSSARYALILRVGPVLGLRPHYSSKVNCSQRHKQLGYGFVLSLGMLKYYRYKIDLAIHLIQAATSGQLKAALNWSLHFSRVVRSDAEIFNCVRANSLQEVNRLLGTGRATVRDCSESGITLLHTASRAGNLQLIQLLIQGGADVNAVDEDGETPLHGAVAVKGNYDTARLLIENGADLSNRAADGKTPLHCIFTDTVGDIYMKEEYLEDVLPDSEGMSITHFLAWSSKSTQQAFEKGHTYDTADIWLADHLGRSCLHLATSRGNLSVLSYLLKRASPFEVNRKDVQGCTPLHYAVQSSRAPKTIELLMANGCSAHAVDNIGQTALHWAATWSNLEAAKKLISLGCDQFLLSPDKNGRLPSELLSKAKEPAFHEFLIAHELPAKRQRVLPNRTTTPRYGGPQEKLSANLGHVSFESFAALLVLILTILLLRP